MHVHGCQRCMNSNTEPQIKTACGRSFFKWNPCVFFKVNINKTDLNTKKATGCCIYGLYTFLSWSYISETDICLPHWHRGHWMSCKISVILIKADFFYGRNMELDWPTSCSCKMCDAEINKLHAELRCRLFCSYIEQCFCSKEQVENNKHLNIYRRLWSNCPQRESNRSSKLLTLQEKKSYLRIYT